MTDFGYDLANFMTRELSSRHAEATEGARADLATMDRRMVFLTAREMFARSCEIPGDGDLIRSIPFSDDATDMVGYLWDAIMALPIQRNGPNSITHVRVWRAMRALAD